MWFLDISTTYVHLLITSCVCYSRRVLKRLPIQVITTTVYTLSIAPSLTYIRGEVPPCPEDRVIHVVSLKVNNYAKVLPWITTVWTRATVARYCTKLMIAIITHWPIIVIAGHASASIRVWISERLNVWTLERLRMLARANAWTLVCLTSKVTEPKAGNDGSTLVCSLWPPLK